MPHPNPALNCTGIKPNFRQQVSAKLNWLKRIAKATEASMQSQSNVYWIIGHAEYKTALTSQQRDALDLISLATMDAKIAARRLIKLLENYSNAEKVPSPKSERRKAVRKAKNTNPSDEKP